MNIRDRHYLWGMFRGIPKTVSVPNIVKFPHPSLKVITALLLSANVYCLSIPLLTLTFFVCADSLALAATLEELRDQFKAEENRIVDYYDELARQPGVDKNQAANLMKKVLVDNRKNYSALAGKDPRYSQADVQQAFEGEKISEIGSNKIGPGYIDEINAELSKKGLKLKSTGGSADLTPSHINADIDTVIVRSDGSPATAAEQLEGIKILEEHGLNKGDIVRQNAARFDNKGKDLTAWKPETKEGQEAKLNDHDAFKTEGGKHVTRNPGAVKDAHGEFLDNQAKFESARVAGDLKTQAKSMFKAGTGEASGVKTLGIDPKTGKQVVVRKSDFEQRNPELYKKAKALKEYGTTHEAGITEVGDSQEVKRQKIEAFQQEMAEEMEVIEKEAARKGKVRDQIRENFQESYDKAGAKDARKGVSERYKTDAELNSERAAGIQDERGRVQKTNQQASEAINQKKARPTPRDTYIGGRKGPGDTGFGEQLPAVEAPDTSIAGKVKNALARLNEMESNLAGVSELPAGASGARVSLNAGAEHAMGAMAVVATANESYSISSKLSRAKILYEAAANEKDDSMAQSYYEQAQKLEQDAIGQAESAGLMMGATLVSPVIVGGALVGAGAYHGTRVILENTETGRAIDEGVRGGMTSVIEGVRDAVTIVSGDQTYDEIAEGTLTARQSTWVEALRKEKIELEEGATVRDVMTLVERNQDKIASFQDLSYLKGVVRLKGNHPNDTGDKKDISEEAANNFAAELSSMKTAIDALDGQAQVLVGEIASTEKTFVDGVKNLTKDFEKTSKDLMSLARDVSSLESLANKMDAKNAEAFKAADDAYSSGQKCAMARGEAEGHATQVCQLGQSIKGTDNVQGLDGYMDQVSAQDASTHSQSEIYRQELNDARMASRHAEGILRELTALRADREEAKISLVEKENLIPSLQSQLDALESQLGSLEGKTVQMPGIAGQASGILGQAQAIDAKQLNKDGKKILKEIQGGYARISKTAAQSEKVFEKNQDKLITPKDKLKNAGDELVKAKNRMESLLSFQINDEVIGKIQKFSEEARASYDAAQLFDDGVREAVRNSETCAREAQDLHAQKISPEAQVARFDCSQWPGTVAQWNSGKKAPECACTSGNLWDENLSGCVGEEEYCVSRADCAGYSNAHPGWDAGQRKAVCYCDDGYEWNSGKTNCRVNSGTQAAQADCSGYPGTSPVWDRGSESVQCNCSQGYFWDGRQCAYQQPPQYPQGGTGQDLGQAPWEG